MSGDANSSASASAGTGAEDLACAYLQKSGLRLLARNYRCRRGEIDLIMQDGEYLVFVEVRYRKNDAFGSAAETVSSAKRARIITTASSEASLALCRELGADVIINYREENVVERVLAETDGKGCHVVFDTVGPKKLLARYAGLQKDFD